MDQRATATPDQSFSNVPPSSSRLANQLSQEISNRYFLSVSPVWISEFLSTVRDPPPPLPALASTANFRLLSSDFTKSLAPFASQQQQQILPRDIGNVHTKHAVLDDRSGVPVPVQVLDVRDVGTSAWNQVEAIERVERGEEVRGREIIRHVPDNDNNNGDTGSGAGQQQQQQRQQTTAGKSNRTTGPHRLLLQDAAGQKVWGFEAVALPKVFVTTSPPEESGGGAGTASGGGLQIGAKLLLKRGTKIRRGLIMMEPATVTVLGGKVDEWDKEWRTSRKQRLMDELKKEKEEREEDTG